MVLSPSLLLRPSRWPGTLVTVSQELSALGLLASRSTDFSGPLGTWSFTLVLIGLLPVLTLVAAMARSTTWAHRIFWIQAMVVFLVSTPDTELLPVRWLLFASLASFSWAFLSTKAKVWTLLAVLAELVLIQHWIPGMTLEPPKPIITLLVVIAIVVPAFLLHMIQWAASRIEDLTDRNDELHASVLQLTNANTEFLEQATMASEESAVLERHRITRDLHDVVGQTLTNIIMMMDAALHRKTQDPDETVKLLKWIRKQAQTGLEETRGVLYELRAFKPATLRGLKALKKLIETFARLSGIVTKVEWGNLPWTFEPEQEKAVYHLIQGSLSNAFRHGLATRIDLHFQVDRGILHIMVRDNGRGGADASSGLGQQGMAERFAQWGGTVSFRSESYGYVVTAAVPLVEEVVKEAESGVPQDPHRR